MRKVYIRTFGCQMNEADSELVCSMLLAQGYEKAGSVDEADVILFNTCSVRKHAEDRVWGKVGELKKVKEKWGQSPVGTVPIFPVPIRGQSPFPVVGIIGCMAKAQKEKIFEKLPHVNFICGPSDIYEVVDLIEKAKENPDEHFAAISRRTRPLKIVTDTSFPKKGTVPIFAHKKTKAKMGQSLYREEKIRAWVNISYGCNNFCSYCVVPYVRGREISRKQKDIIDEIKMLVDDGVKEVTLLGQNVNSYGNDNKKGTVPIRGQSPFCKLLEEINKINGLLRIRFMTSHPKDATVDLFKAMRGLDKVCEHLHLPLQSGSDRILELMNRKYKANDYLKLAEQYRKIVTGGSLTTDIIVGFPTETEEDFYKTYMLMENIKFDSAFIFKYSPRPHTTASKMEDDVEKQIKEQRNQSLLQLQNKIKNQKNKMLINTIQQSLAIASAKRPPEKWEKWGQSPAGTVPIFLKGRTRQNAQVIYEGSPQLIGELSDIKIKDIEENTLIGERV